jgi:hypothetical protein
VSNVVATIIDVRLRSSYTLRLLTGVGFIYATLTNSVGVRVASRKIKNPPTKKEIEEIYRWIEETVPKPKPPKKK